MLDINKIKVIFTVKFDNNVFKCKPIDLVDLLFYQFEIRVESTNNMFNISYDEFLFKYSTGEVIEVEVVYEK